MNKIKKIGRHADKTGQIYGCLTVKSLSHIAPAGRRSRSFWNCLCVCGRSYVVPSERLTPYGAKRSIGCKVCGRQIGAKKQRKPKQAAMTKFYLDYITSSRARNLKFSITRTQFFKLIIQNCHYCDTPPPLRSYLAPNYVRRTEKYFWEAEMNGVDRLDSSKGYSVKNCVPCCKLCNYAKKSQDFKSFILWVRKVYKNTKNLKLTKI